MRSLLRCKSSVVARLGSAPRRPVGPLSGADLSYRSRGRGTESDPDVWSGRAVQEVSSILAMRSCINVSGL